MNDSSSADIELAKLTVEVLKQLHVDVQFQAKNATKLDEHVADVIRRYGVAYEKMYGILARQTSKTDSA